MSYYGCFLRRCRHDRPCQNSACVFWKAPLQLFEIIWLNFKSNRPIPVVCAGNEFIVELVCWVQSQKVLLISDDYCYNLEICSTLPLNVFVSFFSVIDVLSASHSRYKCEWDRRKLQIFPETKWYCHNTDQSKCKCTLLWLTLLFCIQTVSRAYYLKWRFFI